MIYIIINILKGNSTANTHLSLRHFGKRLCLVVALLLISSCYETPQKSSNDPINDAKKTPGNTDNEKQCKSIVTAEVVALEQIITFNRFGAFNPAGMVYALRQDVVYDDPTTEDKVEEIALPEATELNKIVKTKTGESKPFAETIAGRVKIRTDKRPRPLVLRVHEDECLQVAFWNLLSPLPTVHSTFARADFPEGGIQRHAVQSEVPKDVSLTDLSTPPRDTSLPNGFPLPAQEEPDYPTTRAASIHVNGLDYLSMDADGANVGNNKSSLADPGSSKTYTWYARQEGGYFFYSAGALAGGEGDGGQLGLGLFGSVNVEPKGSVWYRSQVTYNDITGAKSGKSTHYDDLNYAKLSILEGNQIIHSDLNAIIYQPNGNPNKDGDLKESGMNCSEKSPGVSCGMSFREFTTIFHDENKVFQAFAELADESNPISAIGDGMAINYGSSGVGSAVLANKKNIGPAKDCKDCKLEEFFLSSWANGDPAMIVKRDINGKELEALYPDDPSNVHHAYLGDPVRFRNIHAGPKETHVFHLHAHQWLQDKNDPNSNYLDSQTISPGSSYTYDINYGGGGNRNLTVGDAIFHCHLYPHFAAGMWELWRNHDVFEDGKPGYFDTKQPISANNDPTMRSLPDYEIAQGTPNPAIVPIPGYALAPMPTADFRGYPFYIAANKGHRPPQPPLDMARDEQGKELNGGLPRHVITDGEIYVKTDAEMQPEALFTESGDPKANKAARYIAKRTWALNSDPNNLAVAAKLKSATIKILPQCGTKDELLAMAFHAGWNKQQIEDMKTGILPKDMPAWCKNDVMVVLKDVDVSNWQFNGEDDKTWPNRKLKKAGGDGKTLEEMQPMWPVHGYHSTKNKAEATAYNAGDLFRVNGYSPAQGAPFADPCPSQYQTNEGSFNVNRDHPRLYKTAYIQFDMTVNKYGWHDPQARMPVLEEDAAPTFSGDRLAEPLFFRANSGDCIQFQATNLIPSNLNLDDFQVFTPTDTIGQHIHLVKFDVTSSDGSANGWNYEDGTFAADEVRERIEASHRAGGGIVSGLDDKTITASTLKAETHPMFKAGGSFAKSTASDAKRLTSLGVCNYTTKENPWCGAQSTVQRWWADPVLNDEWDDRTMRAVFTHDHYGPSSHQQHGFYGALIVEPKDTVWTELAASPAKVDTNKPVCDLTTLGGPLGDAKIGAFKSPCRADGGPTSYAANIGLPMNHPHKDDADHQHVITREYDLAFADFAILYNADLRPVNPPSRQADLILPYVVRDGLKPKPEGISTEDPGTRLLNYRNEPIPLRIAEEDHSSNEMNTPSSLEYHQKTKLVNGKVVVSPEGNLANVFNSIVHSSPTLASASERMRKLQNNVPDEIINREELTNLIQQQLDKTNNFKKLLNKNEPWRVDGDPSTPVLPAYACDPLSIQLIQGAQEEQHVFSMNGVKWLAEPKSLNAGYMNGQQIGISEHFEMEVKLPNDPGVTDYWYGSPSVENFWDGMWGLVRAYGGQKCVPGTNETFADLTINKYKYNQNEKGKESELAAMAKADKIDTILAVLPTKKNSRKENTPDLWDVDEQDPDDKFDVVYKSGEFINDMLKKSSKDPSKKAHLLGYLKEELALDTPDSTEVDSKNKVQTTKDLFREYFNKFIWKKNVCPFNEYVKSGSHKKHVVAILAKDIMPSDRGLVYNSSFNIDDPNGIVFVELDEKWISEHQTHHINQIISTLNQKQFDPRITFHLSASEIVGMLKTAYENGKVLEPLVLRASAGDCIQVTLHNLLPESLLDGPDQNGYAFNSWSYNLMPPIVNGFNFNQVQMSSTINLIPQLVAYDVKNMGGGKIGINNRDEKYGKENNQATSGLAGCRKDLADGKPDFNACDNNIAEYIWYAGNRQEFDEETFKSFDKDRLIAECPIKTKFRKNKSYLCHKPIEFGVASIRSFGDVIKQSSHGAVGALVIEPKDASVTYPNPNSRTTAEVSYKTFDKNGKEKLKTFREFVTVFQDDLSLQQNGQPMPNHRMADDAEDTGQKGFNYRTEPLWARNGVGTSGADFNTLNNVDYSNTLSSNLPNPGCGSKLNSVKGKCGDPETPVFRAKAGSDIRFRLVHPNGHSRQHAFVLHGHNWDYQPWKNDSTEIATPDEKEIKTARLGAIGGIGPGRHFNIVTTAGGVNGVPGDYLFRVQENFQFHGGMWGILRVE